jgi:hypothetical protein
MRPFHRLMAATLMVAVLCCCPGPAFVRADDDKPAAEKPADKAAAEKAAEKAPPTEVTTQGTVTVAGEKIAYTAIAGTLIVGSTDVQDAQLGLDGKPQPGSQLGPRCAQGPQGNNSCRTYVLRGILQEGREGRGPPHHLLL